MRALPYLIACAGAGVIIGPAYGAFARAPFHYPLRLDDVSAMHRAALNVLAVVEWPALFAITFAAAFGLWFVLTPRRTPDRGGPSFRDRWLALMPLAIGHLVTTSVAALTLGYRGESALVHGFALLIGVGLFAAEALIVLPLVAMKARGTA